ncbi:MAG: hypothetical protein C4560_08810 [Nitrospiraceae bacterium]|nr:MAG: hypothetical protein C4560_08810 [Nitrospiraceae bacterium]
MENKTKILLAFPFAFILVLAAAAGYVPFSGAFSETENSMLGFTPTDLSIKEKGPVLISGELKSPIDFNGHGAGEEVPAAKAGVLPAREDRVEANLSLTVISGDRKTAVINGIPVKEGDIVNGMKIARIEPGRVLLKNKTTQWLIMEREK